MVTRVKNFNLENAQQAEQYLKNQIELFLGMDENVFYLVKLNGRQIYTTKETQKKFEKRGLTLNNLIDGLGKHDKNLHDVVLNWLATRTAYRHDLPKGQRAIEIINFFCWSTVGATYLYIIYAKEAMVIEVDTNIAKNMCAYAITQNRYIDAARTNEIISYFKYKEAMGDPVSILEEDLSTARSFREWMDAIEKVQMVNRCDAEAVTPPLHRNKQQHGYKHIMAK